jgi:hypothetical protein
VSGAVINNAVTARRGRVQTVTAQLRITPVALRPVVLPLRADVTILVTTQSGLSVEVDRLFLVELSLHNTTNRDFATFDFGISLPSDLLLVEELMITPDRHHDTEVGRVVESNHGKAIDRALGKKGDQERDYRLKPFNRGDEFRLRCSFAPVEPVERGTEDLDDVEFRPTDAELTKDNFRFSTPELGVRFTTSPVVTRRSEWPLITLSGMSLLLGISGAAISLIGSIRGNVFHPEWYTYPALILAIAAFVATRMLILFAEKRVTNSPD